MRRFTRAIVTAALALAAGAAEWPGFRGPSRQGVAEGASVPEKVEWSLEIGGLGWSSPIVHGRRVYLSTATEGGASCRLMAIDLDKGKTLWDVEVVRQKIGRKEKKNSYASPTPVTDGKSVYVVCGDGTFAAYGIDGKQKWVNADYPHYSQHGLGTSPVLEAGLLIMARDGSSEGEDPKLGWQKPWDQSYVVALDAKTGKEKWKAKRGLSRIAHVTPNVMGSTLVSGAGNVVQGFELKTGKLLWTGTSIGEGVVPSVVLGGGLIYTVSGFEKPTIRAFKPGGEVAWEQTRGVPMISSLLYADGLVYSFTTAGIAWCFRASTGEPVWQGRLGGEFSSSPVLLAGRILIANEQGEFFRLKAGEKFEVEGKVDLGDAVQASPAVSGGRLVVRTAGKLICYR